MDDTSHAPRRIHSVGVTCAVWTRHSSCELRNAVTGVALRIEELPRTHTDTRPTMIDDDENGVARLTHAFGVNAVFPSTLLLVPAMPTETADERAAWSSKA